MTGVLRQLFFCPFPQAVGINVDGVDIGKGVLGIGTVGWDDERGCYTCLANVGGALCVVEVVPRMSARSH